MGPDSDNLGIVTKNNTLKHRFYKLSVSFCAIVLSIALLGYAQSETFQYVYDETGQLIKAIDSTSTVLEYVYDEVGNILEIKRSQVEGLAIFDFTPKQGPIGTKVTISGQGFDPTPANNTVKFNDTVSAITTATPIQLETTVPSGATTGPISVIVGADTAVSSDNFTVIGLPVVTSINPNIWVDGSIIPGLIVVGKNLQDATYSFTPPNITGTLASVGFDGTSSSLTVNVPSGVLGSYVLVATNLAGSSVSSPSIANTLRVVSRAGDEDGDGLSNADELTYGTDILSIDTDGDGFSDRDEILAGSSPTDSDDIPVDPFELPIEAEWRSFAVRNLATPTPESNLPAVEAESGVFSVQNTTTPPQATGLPVVEAESLPFSVENILAP